MNPERYERVRGVFFAASGMEGGERRAYLDRECAGDDGLRREVESLLADDDGTLGVRGVVEAAARTLGGVPESVGRYRVLRLIGSGGMGEVYEARQDDPERSVALKVVRAGVATPEMIGRFRNETRILARLRHPGIAQIYDAGTFGDPPRPYFAMELVEGVPITEWCGAEGLGARERLALLARVCEAVHHAHQRGVIHRDLKPGNILIDETGQPKILDFGVARATDADLQATTLQTGAGSLVGTLPYMSPEQVRGDPDDLDTRADVYALGVLGFELLAGRLPLELARVSVPEAARIIQEGEPTRLGSVRRELRGDAETVIARALSKEKERRYASAADLAADLGRFLRDEPIEARPASTVYQLRKFARRNRGLVGGVLAAFLALVVGLVGTIVFAMGEARERGAAQARARELELVTAFQSSMLRQIEADAMGRDMLGAMRGQVEAALLAGARPRAEIDAELAAFDRLAARVNATTVAVGLLDDHVLERTARTIDAEFGGTVAVSTALRQDLADLSRHLGLLDRALAEQERAVADRLGAFGPDDPRTLDSINGLGLTLQALGRHGEAEARYAEALEGRRRVLGESDPDTLSTRNNLGHLMRVVGRTEEAEAEYRLVLAGRRDALGPDHRDTITSVNNMALLLKSRGELAEAAGLYGEGVASARAALGDDDPLTLSLIANMAACLETMGRREEALPLYEEALAGRRRVLGDDHPETLTSINNMGYVLRVLERHAEALPLNREAYERRVRLLGPDHPSAITSLNNLAAALRSMGELDEAIALQREAVERAARVRGEAHTVTLVLTGNLAGMLRERGEPDAALRLSETVAERARASLPEGHWRLGVLLTEHGRCLGSAGRAREAREVLSEALALLSQALGDEDSRTIEAREALERAGRGG